MKQLFSSKIWLQYMIASYYFVNSDTWAFNLNKCEKLTNKQLRNQTEI